MGSTGCEDVNAGSVGEVTSSRADWARLNHWLVERTEPVVIIAWGELNAIVGGLPDSATKHYPQWWHGDRPNTRAWRRAGYELERVDLGRTVTLRKSAIAWTPPTADHATPHPSAHQARVSSQLQDSGAIDLQAIDPRSALILLPCSGSKAGGGANRSSTPPSFWTPELRRARAGLHAAAHVDERQVMPAWQRYTGGFYQAAGSSLAEAVSDGAHVAILSGGYGVVRADETIGAYDKELWPADWPGGVLEDALIAEAIRIGATDVVAFAAATTGYARIIRRTPWRRAGVRRAVLVTVISTGGGAMVKVPRDLGLAFRAFWYGLPVTYPAGIRLEELT